MHRQHERVSSSHASETQWQKMDGHTHIKRHVNIRSGCRGRATYQLAPNPTTNRQINSMQNPAAPFGGGPDVSAPPDHAPGNANGVNPPPGAFAIVAVSNI
jgi:hypothetical protein